MRLSLTEGKSEKQAQMTYLLRRSLASFEVNRSPLALFSCLLDCLVLLEMGYLPLIKSTFFRHPFRQNKVELTSTPGYLAKRCEQKYEVNSRVPHADLLSEAFLLISVPIQVEHPGKLDVRGSSGRHLDTKVDQSVLPGNHLR